MSKEKEIELIEKAIIDICPRAIPTSEYVSGIGCADKGVECDCFCSEACIIERIIKAGYRNIGEAWVDEKDLKGDTLADVIERAIGEIDRVRKETAKEIFNALYHQEEIGFDKIKWFAKYYYGVEVDE